MNLTSKNQIQLYGYPDQFNNLVDLFNQKKLPTKILLSGEKGIGKCTCGYHLVNYILSNKDDNAYDLKNLIINKNNKDFITIQNNSNPNFVLIDLVIEKKMIEIAQIRALINQLQKSSFNSKPRLILIDNIEYLNANSVNALLKILEEPGENIYFLLIHNNRKVLPTLLSRCLNFKLNLSNKNSIEISNKLANDNVYFLLNKDLLDYYSTPGKIYKLIKFAEIYKIDLKKLDIKNFLFLMIDEKYYKRDNLFKTIIYEFLELFLIKKSSILTSEVFNYFIQKLKFTKKFNLDEEVLFLEFKSKILNE